MEFPNGSVITPDGHTLIVGESMGRRYTAFDIRADGTLENRRVWAQFTDIAPDGCTLDAEGAIWVRQRLRHRRRPCARGWRDHRSCRCRAGTYACALGGDDGRTLFILSADSADEKVMCRERQPV